MSFLTFKTAFSLKGLFVCALIERSFADSVFFFVFFMLLVNWVLFLMVRKCTGEWQIVFGVCFLGGGRKPTFKPSWLDIQLVVGSPQKVVFLQKDQIQQKQLIHTLACCEEEGE